VARRRDADRDGSRLVEEAVAYLQHQEELGEPDRSTTPQPRKPVLLAYAGSEPERRLLETVASLSYRLGDEVSVFHVREYDICRGSRFFLETPAEAASLTLDAVSRLQRAGIAASGVVCNENRSNVAQAILDEASKIGACAILLCGRLSGVLMAALFGSVSRRIVRRSSCPVVLVNAPVLAGRGTVTSRSGRRDTPGGGERRRAA